MTYRHRERVEVGLQLHSFVTSALDGVENKHQATLPQDKHSLPLYRMLGRTQGPSGRVSRRDNTLLPPEFKPQPMHYTEYAFPAPAIRYAHFIFVYYLLKFCGERVLWTDALTFYRTVHPHPTHNRLHTLPPKDRARGKLRYAILRIYTFVCTGAIID